MNSHTFNIGDRVRPLNGSREMIIEAKVDKFRDDPDGPIIYVYMWFEGDTQHRFKYTTDDLVFIKHSSTGALNYPLVRD